METKPQKMPKVAKVRNGHDGINRDCVKNYNLFTFSESKTD